MKIRILVFVLSLLLSTASYPDQFSSALTRGLEKCYHFNWESGEDSFRTLIQSYPEDPRGYHYLSGIYLWHYLGNGDKVYYDQFFEYSDLAIEKAGEILEHDELNADVNYTKGANYSYRSIAFAKAGNYLDAAWASKKSESYLTTTLKLNPEYYDAYMGLGLYNFAVSQIPPAFSWALSLAGIKGDKEIGFDYLKLAANKGNYARVEAKYYLSQIASEFIIDYKTAADYLESLVDKFPENLLFNYAYAVINFKQHNVSVAEKHLKRVLKSRAKHFEQVKSYSNFLLGDIHFRKNNFEDAKEYYLIFLNSASENDYKGISAYRLALSYELTGNRETALNYYRNTEKGNMDIEDDVFASRKAGELLKSPLSQDEMKLIKSANYIESGSYTRAVDSLAEIKDAPLSGKLKAETAYLMSEAFFHLKKYQESLKCAMEAVELETGDEEWIHPFALYNAARANKKLNDIKAMGDLIKQAEDFSDYDYKKKLSNMIYSLQRR